MTVTDQFPGNFIKAGDLDGKERRLTILAVAESNTERAEDKRLIDKPILTFKEAKRRLVLNVTNAESVRLHHGNDMSKWPGKEITLYPTTTRLGGEVVPCIRIIRPRLQLPSHKYRYVDSPSKGSPNK